MSNLKDWDTPFGPSEVLNDIVTNDKIPTPKLLEDIGWDSFRREAAKDILCAMLSSKQEASSQDITTAISIADELIKQLREAK